MTINLQIVALVLGVSLATELTVLGVGLLVLRLWRI